jgi:hypothetical protein
MAEMYAVQVVSKADRTVTLNVRVAHPDAGPPNDNLGSALMMLLEPAEPHSVLDKNFDEGSGATYDCGEDPVVNISTSTSAYTLTGACKEVNVNGSMVTLTVADVDTVNLNGASNKVTLGVVGKINVNGTKNKITWSKAKKGKKPGVLVNGRGNAIAKK